MERMERERAFLSRNGPAALILPIAILVSWGVAFAEGSIAFLRHSGSFYQVWIMDTEGEGQRQLTFSAGDKVNLSWSADGKEILYNTSMGELFILDVEKGKDRRVDIGMRGMTDAEWSPDGRQVLFSLSTTNSIDTNDIWLVSLDGKKKRKLTHMRNMQHHPVWADQGRSIVFLSGKGDEVHNIWITDRDGRAPGPLTVNSGYNFEPDCSVDNELAFSSDRSGNYELFLMDLQGKKVSNLTGHPGLDTEPSWSPDGRGLVFVSNRSGTLQIWKIDRDGSGVKQLTEGPDPSRTPKWGSKTQ